MKPEEPIAYTARCFRGKPAPCSGACPFGLDVRSFLGAIDKGRWGYAHKLLRNAVVFPGIVSVLCDQPCREVCQRKALGDEAIALRDLEAGCIRHTRERRPEFYAIPPKQQRVAVVGAGPAGLSAALNLAQKQYSVTVFEREDGWGGSLRPHPRFADFDADIALQFSATKVDFRFGTDVATLDALGGFDAVYIATGAGGESFGLLGSWEEDLLATSVPKAFMGGALCGADLMEGIAQGVRASKVIEVFLQTGKAARVHDHRDTGTCDRVYLHRGAVSTPRVVASTPGGYSDTETKTEAARCLQCDCDACLAGCEMLTRFRKDPHKLAVEVYADMGANPPLSVRTLTREVYSCNLCGHCKTVCPEDVDVGGLLRLSRKARMSAGIAPAALHDFWLREMDFAGTEGALAAAPRGKSPCAYAFYPGCQLGAARPEHVLGTYEALAGTYDMGVILGCCGAPAYWAGDEARLGANLAGLRQVWEHLGRPTLVLACATCSLLFATFLPEIPRVSVYELLGGLEGLSPASPFPQAAVFDPCAARDDTGMEAAVRALAGRAGVTLTELAEKHRCCGYGGHMRLANPSLYQEIIEHRAGASELPYLVYCANCREVFATQGKACAHILEVALGLEPDFGVPTLEEKRRNSLQVKRELMQRLKDEEFSPQPKPGDDLTLVIPPKVQREMEAKLIAASALREAIWRAEASGEGFVDEAGARLASLTRPVLTYWVEYRERGPRTYEVLAAYYHRMRVERET